MNSREAIFKKYQERKKRGLFNDNINDYDVKMRKLGTRMGSPTLFHLPIPWDDGENWSWEEGLYCYRWMEVEDQGFRWDRIRPCHSHRDRAWLVMHSLCSNKAAWGLVPVNIRRKLATCHRSAYNRIGQKVQKNPYGQNKNQWVTLKGGN